MSICATNVRIMTISTSRFSYLLVTSPCRDFKACVLHLWLTNLNLSFFFYYLGCVGRAWHFACESKLCLVKCIEMGRCILSSGGHFFLLTEESLSISKERNLIFYLVQAENWSFFLFVSPSPLLGGKTNRSVATYHRLWSVWLCPWPGAVFI